MIPALLLLGLTALVGELGFGFGLLSKASRELFAEGLWRGGVRSGLRSPFCAVKPCVAEGPQLLYEAACRPPASFKPARLEYGTDTKRESQTYLLLIFPANLIQSLCLLRNGLTNVTGCLMEAIHSSFTEEAG